MKLLGASLLQLALLAVSAPDGEAGAGGPDVSDANHAVFFAKFHKVASTSVQELLLQAYPDFSSWYNSEDAAYCGTDPFDHSGLSLYIQHGRSTLLDHCFVDKSRKVMFSTILRDPLERFHSLIRFFGNLIDSRIKREVPEGLRANALAVVKKTKEDKGQQVSVQEMTDYLNATHERYSKNKRFSPIHNQHPYQAAFGRDIRGPFDTPDIISTALRNLEADFDLVGTMEAIASYYTLLSRVLGFNITKSCDKYIVRRNTNCMQYNKTSRATPACQKVNIYESVRRIYSVDVVSVLESYFAGEIRVYQAAQDLHRRQVQRLAGLSVTAAADLWSLACGERKNKMRLMSKGEKVNLHTISASLSS